MSDPYLIREVRPSDLEGLVHLHVTAWNQTYPHVENPPTHAIRERQWRRTFQTTDGSWFCFVVENEAGELVGFARGRRYSHPDQPRYDGELNKLYLLREYHRRGLGRRLVGWVARRFLAMEIRSMLLFAEADNPACRFYEALGGELLQDGKGQPTPGNYGWTDLERLAALCPPE